VAPCRGSSPLLGDFNDNRITLTACHPKFSARQRIIVAAELVSAPVGTPPPPEEYVTADEIEFATEDHSITEAEATGGLGADEDFVGAGGVINDEDGDTGSDEPPAAAAFIDEVSLDEGLNGDKDALLPAIGWGVAALAAYLAFKELGKRWRRWPAIAIGIVPVVVLMALSFEKVDRYLPAG